MCGISGIALKHYEVAQPSLLQAMAELMRHRGPDAGGVFTEGCFGLAHRRLKVIDLSTAANQPFSSHDGKVSIVFNGEVYNFKALREELIRIGRRFRSSSDTEVILQAYEEWGKACFTRLNGMFAFGLLDRRGQDPELHLVRDRFGIKPLFYCLKQGRLAFSSEIKPLLVLDWISRDLDMDSVFYFLKFSHVPNPSSIFSDIMQLRPGCALTLKNGQATLTRYFDPISISTPASDGNNPRDEAGWLALLDRTLDSVVNRQIESDVPVGCFLSGGVDSSLLALTHARLSPAPIDTFTIKYREAEFDESAYAAQVARATGSRHHEILVSPSDLFSLIDDAPEHFDQPFADPTLLPMLILARETRKHVKVALSGDGGDELFFGYSYQRALLSLQNFNRLPRWLRQTLATGSAPLGTLLGKRKRQQWDKLRDILSYRNETELFQYFIGTIGPMRLDRLSRLMKCPADPRKSSFSNFWPELKDMSWTGRIDQVFLRTFLTDTVLAKTDRAGMAYGLEARVPFLDDEMVDFSTRLPFDLKLRQGRSKYLLRRLLETKLPGNLAYRKKQGFSIPLRDWLRKELKPWVKQYLDPVRIKREGLFSPTHVSQVVAEHMENRANHSHLIFSMISFQMWKERYSP